MFVVVLCAAYAAPGAAQRGGCLAPSEPTRRSVQDSIAASATRTIADSIRAAILNEVGPESAPAGLVLIELSRAREVSSVRVVGGNVSAEVVGRVASGHRALLAHVPPRWVLLDVRLDRPALPESPSVECLPQPRDTRRFQDDLMRIARGMSPGSARETVNLQMLVSRDGEVVYARVVRPGASQRLDRDVANAARRLRFHPATADGIAVDVWVEQPVQLVRG